MRTNILFFACGVLLLQLQGELPSPGVIAGMSLGALAALAGAAVTRLRPHWQQPLTRVLPPLAGLLLGFVWAGTLASLRLADALPEAWETRDIEITGVVATLPQRFERGERFEFVTESVGTAGAHVPGRILLSWYRSRDAPEARPENEETTAPQEVRPGQRWRFTVRLKRPHGQANAHGFDYEAWLLERSLRATGYIRPGARNACLDAFVPRPAYVVERLREGVRRNFLAALPEAPYLGVLIALSIGDQRAIPNAQWQIFNRTGITHLVSISGLHVTLVAALLAALVNGLWRRSERLMLSLPAQQAAIAAGGLAALFYALLAGFEVPAQRTLYMLVVVALALWSGRNFAASRVLLLAMLVVLVLDPWAVLATGFWLSFGAVALLFYAGNARLGERRGWRTQLRLWGVTQWAVTLGSLPLLLFFFQQFSLVSPLANALAIPWVSFVVTPLALLFTILPWPPLLALDHALLAQLMRVLEALAGWPLWQQAAPPLWTVFLALTGVLWLLLPRGFPARWLGLCLLLPALCWPPPRPAEGEAWVEVLDVGQGLAVVVQTAAHALLFDSGPQYSADSNAGQRVVVPYLRAAGVRQLDALVISHRDLDHSGGLAAVQAELPVGRLLTSYGGFGGEPCVAGQHWQWEGVQFTLLHPTADDYARPRKKSNNLSCVLRVTNAAGSVLLAADIEAADERALLKRAPEALRSSVLVVPHHGSSTSSTPAFIAAVGARAAVFSAGYRNAFRHPRPEILTRYAGSRVWRTDLDGAIGIRLPAATDAAVAMSAWRHERRRYWHGR
jgi:competence protein ComEC